MTTKATHPTVPHHRSLLPWLLLAGLLTTPAAARTLSLFILTGQSNSLGTPTTTTTNMLLPRMAAHAADGTIPFFWDNTADGTIAGDLALGTSAGWTNICPQLGGYYALSQNHWGPEVGFARMLWDAGCRDFGIIKASRGGGGNSFWNKTNADHHMYEKVVRTALEATTTLPAGFTDCRVAGLLYLQGESNDATEASEAGNRFSELLQNLRSDLPNASSMVGILGQIASDSSGNRMVTTQKQLALASARQDIGFAQSAGLSTHNLDGLNVHYDADSLLIMGERMASESFSLGVWTNSSIPILTGLHAWYRGDHGVVPKAGLPVSRWDNLANGATNADLTQIVGQPVLASSIFQGGLSRACIRLEGTQAAWSTSANFGALTNSRSILFALRLPTRTDGFLFDGSTSSGMSRAQVRDGSWQTGLQAPPIANAANADSPTTPITTGSWQVHAFDFTRTNNGTRVRHWVDGLAITNFLDPDQNGLGGFIIGANAQAQRFLPVDIGEILVYNRELSDEERSTLTSRMALTWHPQSRSPDPSSVYAWFRGDDGLEMASDLRTVTRWTNSGSRTVTGISQAARDLAQLTGAPKKSYLRLPDGTPAGAVRFEGTDGIWAQKANFGIISNDRTLITMARVMDARTQGFLFDATSYTPGLTRVQVRTGYWHVATSGSTSTAYGSNGGTPTAPVSTNRWEVHSFLVRTNPAGARFQHFIGGVLAGDVPLPTNGAMPGLMVGANASQALGIKADVAELLVFDSALPDATRTNIEAYLSSKWTGVVDDTNTLPASTAPPFSNIFAAGESGYTCFRIPGIVTSTNGTVIAVADGRIGSCGDIPTPLDLVCKRSFDNGRSWEPLQIIANYGSDPADVDDYPFYGATSIQRVAAGDAAMLVDQVTGRIWTLYDNGGVSGSRRIKLELRNSDDDGATWSPAIDLERSNPGLRPATGEFLAGPGNGIQMSSGPRAGRLIFPVYIYAATSSSLCIYSDDHGATWQRGGISGIGGGEVQMAETAGGGLIASMRDNNFATSGRRTFSRSQDAGITWGTPFSDTTIPPYLPDPGCQGNIYRLTTTNDGDRSRILHASATHISSRVNMSFHLSYDEGSTWPVSNQVYAAGSAYSSVTRLASGEIGLIFEKDPYGSLSFTWRSIREITAGNDFLPPFEEWKASRFTPPQLMNPSISGPGADPDHDGYSNQEEFLAGTEPGNSESRPQFKITPGTNSTPMLRFQAATNRTYIVENRTGITTGSWVQFANITNPPEGTPVEIPAANTNKSGYFRLRISQTH